jgi:hypothetical protein
MRTYYVYRSIAGLYFYVADKPCDDEWGFRLMKRLPYVIRAYPKAAA